MKTLPKNHAEFCNMLYQCIDLSHWPENTALKSIIENETRKKLSINSVEDWLRGLPSACIIPFADWEILEILQSSGNAGWSIDEYWRFAASRVIEFAKFPKAYQ